MDTDPNTTKQIIDSVIGTVVVCTGASYVIGEALNRKAKEGSDEHGNQSANIINHKKKKI